MLLNTAFFQATWFGCVLGGASGEWLWGATGVAALVVFSLSQCALQRDLRFVVVLVCVGFGLDSLWASTGVLDYGTNALPIVLFGAQLNFAPVWITLLWAGVGLTLMHSLGFFVSRPWLGALMAGFASVTSYLAGERLGACVVPQVGALGFISASWLIVFFGMFSWARRLDSGRVDSSIADGSVAERA